MTLTTLQHRITANWKWFIADARNIQIIFLSTFLFYGIVKLHWTEHLLSYFIIVSSALFTQFAFGKKLKIRVSYKSVFITSLGLCLLFKANSPIVFAFAAFCSIASKFLIRHQGKHIFNPANFGIIFPILITADGWISPGQWGSGGMLLFLFAICGLFILRRVNRLDTCFTFFIVFGGLEFFRSVVFKGWPVDFWFHQFSSGSILLFTFFMITDPVTTPKHPKARIIWAILIGITSFILTEWFFVFTAPLWALFFSAPVTALLNIKFKARSFNWQTRLKQTKHHTSDLHNYHSLQTQTLK